MAENGKPREERAGTIETPVSDKGHHELSHCGECLYDLTGVDPLETHCPNCHIKFNWGEVDDDSVPTRNWPFPKPR